MILSLVQEYCRSRPQIRLLRQGERKQWTPGQPNHCDSDNQTICHSEGRSAEESAFPAREKLDVSPLGAPFQYRISDSPMARGLPFSNSEHPRETTAAAWPSGR